MSTSYPIKETSFKGNPVFNIKMGEYESKGEKKENIFGFGVKKAEAILENIEAIKNL